MQRFWAQPLRRQLVIAILLLLLPVLIAAVWSGFVTFRERQQELGDQARIVAATTAAYINRGVANLDALARRIQDDPAAHAGDIDALRELVTRSGAGRSGVLRFSLVNSTGEELARVDATSEPLEKQDWWSEAIAAGRRAVVPTRAAPSGAVRYIVLGYPITSDAGVRLALGIFVDVGSLDDTFGLLPLPGGSVVNIVDFQGNLLARSVEAEEWIGHSMVPVRQTREAVALAPYEAAGLDGVNRVYGEAVIDAGPWVVMVGIPTSLAADRAVSLWARSFAILLLGVLGWLVVALVLSRRLASSVNHLDVAAQRIAAGDFSMIETRPMPSRELNDLQQAFQAMLERFNQTRQALDAQMAEERRIRQELESLQGQVIRQERLAAVGQLVSGVAHEINNPLQAILGFAELLQMQDDLPGGAKNDLKLIQKESARACGIIRNLALFARQQPGPAAPLRLIDVIASVAELRQRRLESEDIELQIDDRSAQQVNAVMTELQQVLLNFVVNAEQAILMSKRLPGRITIRGYDREKKVVLEVEDTGPGVPPEHEAKLFQPFFTTKPVGQGTGLGLSVSYGIIDSLRGHIGYRRSATGGSIFYFELPAVPSE